MRATSRAARTLRTAPVSHQKRLGRSITNAIEIERKRSKINKADRYSAAHNGLVGGSSPPGPTKFRCFRVACTRMFAFDSRQSLVNRWSDGRGVLSYHGPMILPAEQHRAVPCLLRRKAEQAPDPIVMAQLLRLAGQHQRLARYLDKHPDRYCPVVTIVSPPLAP
jgi:hypothetical protein